MREQRRGGCVEGSIAKEGFPRQVVRGSAQAEKHLLPPMARADITEQVQRRGVGAVLLFRPRSLVHLTLAFIDRA